MQQLSPVQTLSGSRIGKFNHELSLAELMHLFLGMVLAPLLSLVLSGCGYSGSTGALPVALSGSVHGGHLPIEGAKVVLYAAGTQGPGSAAQPLLTQSVQTDSNGNFVIPADYECPSASSQVYVVARGGTTGTSSTSNGSTIQLMAMLGTCGGLAKTGTVSINEVTTVGSVWPLARFITSADHLGSDPNDAAFDTAVASVPQFINLVQGSSPGTPTPKSYFAQSSKLYSLADVLTTCADSGAGQGGNGTACGQLFSTATPPGGNLPADIMTAAIQIAQNPGNNVTHIYDMIPASAPFAPTVTTVPADWTLSLAYIVATPVISVASGTYSGAQQVSINDSTPGASIYYTTDGSMPSHSSALYTGPISIDSSSTVQTIAILSGSQSAVAASILTIILQPLPASLSFLQEPSNIVAGTPIKPAVRVVEKDSGGNIVTSATNTITLSLSGGSGITSSWTALPVNGVATFSGVTVGTVGSYLLLATGSNLTAAVSTSFDVSAAGEGTTPSPTKLAFLQQPVNALAGATLSPAVEVVVEDANGSAVAGANNPITISLPDGNNLGGTLTVTPKNGIATFDSLIVVAPGGHTLLASSPGLASITSNNFAISTPSPSAAKLVFRQEPSNALPFATISPAVQVVVEDVDGNAVSDATNAVTIALEGGAGLGGTLTVNAIDGVATFSNLSVSNVGSGLVLAATSANLTSATSTPFATNAPGNSPLIPVKMAFVQQPSNELTGVTISPAVQVTIEDVNGNVVTTATNAVTVALMTGSGLTGTLTVSPQNGIVTFNNLAAGTAGTYVLSATSPDLTSATSTGFTITAPSTNPPPPAPVRLAYLQQPSNAVALSIINPAIRVAVEDASGNVMATATNPVTLKLVSGTGLGGVLTATPVNGVATFSNLTVNAAGTYTLSATSTDLTSAISSSFTITSPIVPPAKLAFVVQPSAVSTSTVMTPAVHVAVENASGSTMTTALNPVTLALTNGSGLTGTLVAIPVNGIATFTDLSLSAAGSYSLSATSAGLTSATSNSFAVTSTAALAAKLLFTVQPTSTSTSSTIAPAVRVAIAGADGTTVTTATNSVTLALAGGTPLSGTVTATPVNGVASFSNLSVSTAGTYRISASSAGLASATSSSFSVTANTPTGKTYYLAVNGNDKNDGLSAALPWLTPNHALNCGDTILAAPSTAYQQNNFGFGKWGAVTAHRVPSRMLPGSSARRLLPANSPQRIRTPCDYGFLLGSAGVGSHSDRRPSDLFCVVPADTVSQFAPYHLRE